MDDINFFSAFVADQYGQAPSHWQPLPSSIPGRRHVAYLRFPDGQQWQLKARHQTLTPLGPPADLAQWLQGRATLLERLAEHMYPAPRVVRTTANSLVGFYAGWYCLAVTWIDGTVIDLTPTYAHRAGQTLGDLHRMTTYDTDNLPLEQYATWWHPTHAVPIALANLAATVTQIPAQWAAFHSACFATLTAIQHWLPLPQAIIHADCWAGNMVQTSSAETVFIDWDTAGIGPAVLDVGDVLIGCLVPLTDPYRPDVCIISDRVTAVVEGYCQRRLPTEPELAVLLDAVRYGAVFRGTQTFGRIVYEGWTPAIERELERQARRYTNSTAVTTIARAVFEQRLRNTTAHAPADVT